MMQYTFTNQLMFFKYDLFHHSKVENLHLFIKFHSFKIITKVKHFFWFDSRVIELETTKVRYHLFGVIVLNASDWEYIDWLHVESWKSDIFLIIECYLFYGFVSFKLEVVFLILKNIVHIGSLKSIQESNFYTFKEEWVGVQVL